MAFENLSERLQGALKRIQGKVVSENDLKELMREIRLALLEADVNLSVVKEFTKAVRTRALGTDVSEALTNSQQIIKIVDEELTKVLGGETVELNKSAKIPTIVMMVGLQGAGKTTLTGKLAKKLIKDDNARPLLIAADVYRPAAIDQLKTLGEQIGAPVFALGTDVNPRDIVKQGLAQAAANKNDYVFIDTAGRLEIDENLMLELKDIKALAKPDEIMLVVDAMTGQVAADVAKKFDEELDITGVSITKLDSDTRGGAALSIRYITGKPIKFVGVGEKLDDLEVFHPDRMSSRILGMGDLLTLIEKAQTNYDEEKSAELMDKMREATFDFNDFLEQLEQVNQMGPLEDIMKMIPGMNQVPAGAMNIDEKQMRRQKAMVQAMTPEERRNPSLLNPSRRRRIAAGSANTVVEVNKMIKSFNQARDMMAMMSGGKASKKMQKMMKQMGMDPGSMGRMPGAGGGADLSQMASQLGIDPATLPDMNAMGGAGMPDMSSMFGGGLKGKAASAITKRALKKAMKKKKK
ncbi:MAG: signal recognition particle protein [Lactobacillales bacterium]|jgi:signal recognition particle subunit SRP54|nr:signal recognition particle protein [Lactobacillales bacterium]